MSVYPWDPIPELTQIAFLERDGYNDFHVSTGMHVWTHMDAPLHMIQNWKYLTEYPVDKFFNKWHLIDAREKPINSKLLNNKNIHPWDMVLIWTGFEQYYWTSYYYESYPEIMPDFANKIVELWVSIVGVDTPSPDRAPYDIHKILLSKDVLIIENISNLHLLQDKEFTITALPAKFYSEAAPVRVVAKLL